MAGQFPLKTEQTSRFSSVYVGCISWQLQKTASNRIPQTDAVQALKSHTQIQTNCV